MDLTAYLARIGYSETPAVSLPALGALHRAHLLAVPFENLDIPLGRRITLAPGALWDKIVVRRRGGFCYELNTLFGRLLQALGYQVEFLSARVWGADGFGPDKDHMALLVRVDGEAWLADVGFGDSFVAPLRLVPDIVQADVFTEFRLIENDDLWTMEVRAPDGSWRPEYRFGLQACAPDSFQAMCDYQQTSPESSFTRRVVCSRLTASGRVTVTHDRVIVTIGSERDEKRLADAAAFRAALEVHHGVSLTAAEAAAILARFPREAR